MKEGTLASAGSHELLQHAHDDLFPARAHGPLCIKGGAGGKNAARHVATSGSVCSEFIPIFLQQIRLQTSHSFFTHAVFLGVPEPLGKE